jgi:hypothetical protein
MGAIGGLHAGAFRLANTGYKPPGVLVCYKWSLYTARAERQGDNRVLRENVRHDELPGRLG